MTTWGDLTAELDRWSAAGRKATFWWRDDDAGDFSPGLRNLLEFRRGANIPLALAVIPAVAGTALVEALAAENDVRVLQHGFAHVNHEPAGRPKSELGRSRAGVDATRELEAGRDRLSALFGAMVVPVLVPPWNRIDPAVVEFLPGLGYRGISTFRRRQEEEAAPGVVRVNTHVDIIDWRGSRGFCGEEIALSATVDHLAARRSGAADGGEPTGLLTHHRMHEAACMAFLSLFTEIVSKHPAASWVSADDLFDAGRWQTTAIAAAR